MQTDLTTRLTLAQRYPAELRAEIEHNRLVKRVQADTLGSSVRQPRTRLGEALASAWISLGCAWRSARAGEAPSRC